MLDMGKIFACGKSELKRFFKEENGDTNFISIIIVLAVVMVVAAIFLGFRTQIVEWVNTTFNTAFDSVKNDGSKMPGFIGGF